MSTCPAALGQSTCYGALGHETMALWTNYFVSSIGFGFAGGTT